MPRRRWCSRRLSASRRARAVRRLRSRASISNWSGSFREPVAERQGRMRLLIGLAAALLVSATLPSQPASAAATLDRVQRADGAQIVPERFLRRWDPITIFLDRDAGPAAGGPEDQAEKYATIAPAPAGSWQWLEIGRASCRERVEI